MYNQQPNYQSSGITANSQFKGMQRQQYEPAGQVQSYYQGIGQSTNQYPTTTGSQFQGQSQYGQQFASPGQFHSSNYRGDQAGHDTYLRADSTTPSQYGGANQSSGYQNAGRSSMSSQFGFQGQGGQGQTNQFHSANYRGNQQGHDSYLRADSTQPSNMQQQYGFRS